MAMNEEFLRPSHFFLDKKLVGYHSLITSYLDSSKGLAMNSKTILSVEHLENRNQPSVITLSGNTINYTASDDVENNVSILQGQEEGQIEISDYGEEITQVPEGWTSSNDNHTATGSYGANSELNIDVKNLNDSVTGYASPIKMTVAGREGDDYIFGSDFDDWLFGGAVG
jgi:hypothetical protein